MNIEYVYNLINNTCRGVRCLHAELSYSSDGYKATLRCETLAYIPNQLLVEAKDLDSEKALSQAYEKLVHVMENYK